MKRTLAAVNLLVVVLLLFVASCGSQPGEREFEKGIKEIERGHHVRGITLLEKSIIRRPGSAANAMAYNYIGLAYWRLDKPGKAVEAFRESQLMDSEYFDPIYNLGVVYAGEGDFQAASRHLREAALLRPDDPRPLEFLAHLYMDEERWEQAAALLTEADERVPGSPSILTALARAALHVRGPQDAAVYLEAALQADPKYPPALFNLGLVFAHELGDTHKAADMLERYLAVGKNETYLEDARRTLKNLASIVSSSERKVVEQAMTPTAFGKQEPTPQELPKISLEQLIDDLLMRAKAQSEHGRSTQALDLTLQAAERAEKAGRSDLQEKALKMGVKLCPKKSVAYASYAAYLNGQGKSAGALRLLKEGSAQDDASAEIQMSLSGVAMEEGEYDTALVALKRVVKMQPDNADAVWNLARLFDEHIGHEENAIVTYRHFMKLFPNDSRLGDVRTRLSEIDPSYASRDEDEAEGDGVRSRRITYKKPAVRNMKAAVQAYNQGTIYQERRDWDRAIYYYTRAVENDDLFANAFFNLGTVYSTRGDLDLAQDAYERAIKTRPDMVNARYNLALLHNELEQDREAITQLEYVLEEMPDYAPAHYLMGLLCSKDPATKSRAKTHYRKFLSLSPSGPAAATAKEWLRTN